MSGNFILKFYQWYNNESAFSSDKLFSQGEKSLSDGKSYIINKYLQVEKNAVSSYIINQQSSAIKKS